MNFLHLYNHIIEDLRKFDPVANEVLKDCKLFFTVIEDYGYHASDKKIDYRQCVKLDVQLRRYEMTPYLNSKKIEIKKYLSLLITDTMPYFDINFLPPTFEKEKEELKLAMRKANDNAKQLGEKEPYPERNND